MIRIDADTDIGINRNSSDWLGMNFYPILSPEFKTTEVHIIIFLLKVFCRVETIIK